MKIALCTCRFFLAATALVACATVTLAAESKNTLKVRFTESEPDALKPAGLKPDALKPDAPTAQLPESVPAPSAMPAPFAAEDWADDATPWQHEFESDCQSCCWLRRLPWRSGKGTVYFGADYLLVKPRFSQSIARVDRTRVTDTTVTPQLQTSTDESIAFEYDYQTSCRAFIGYHSCRCGGDIQFSYWRLQGDGSSGPSPAADIDAGTLSGGQLNNITSADGDRLNSTSSVQANLFDLDFTRCLSLGGSPDPCDACACPRWDVRWSAGVRIAEFDRQDDNVLNSVAGEAKSFGHYNADFRGAGPRVGMQGRRYFGECARFSLFAKGSTALLLGESTAHRELSTPAATPGGTSTLTVQDDSVERMVPMAEIEFGASYQVGQRMFVTAGWMFQAWFDVASSPQILGTNFGPLDTANITAFDGLFVRGEYMF